MGEKISQLPAATQANLTDALEKSDQGGAPSQRLTIQQIFTLLQATPNLAFVGPITVATVATDALGNIVGPNSNWLINRDGTVNFSGGLATIDINGNLVLAGASSTISSGAGNFVVNSGGNITVPVTALTPSAGTTYIADLSKPYQAITTNAAIDLTTSSNRPAASFARSTTIRYNTSASIRALTFNASWVFLGTAPTSLPANKVAIITLTAFGSAETDIVAAYRAVD